MMGRIARLPLGVDIAAGAVSVVAAEAHGRTFVVRDTCTLPVDADAAADGDRAVAVTLRRALGSLRTRERRCVLGAPADDVATRTFVLPPALGRAERERAAELEADALGAFAPAERLVALDELPDRDDAMLLSVARHASVERLVDLARAAGLRPVAVDVPFCAWRRALPNVDAVLDGTADRAALTIFGNPLGTTVAYPARLLDERLAAHVRAALVEARREGFADVRRIAVVAAPARFRALSGALGGDGYAVESVRLGDAEAPTWAFAYGLATWAVAPRGVVTR